MAMDRGGRRAARGVAVTGLVAGAVLLTALLGAATNLLTGLPAIQRWVQAQSAMMLGQATCGLVLLVGVLAVLQHRLASAEPAAAAGAVRDPLPPAHYGRIWNVAQPVASFTGRDSELAALDEAVRGGGRLVLSGLPGMGKTQLALAWTHLRAADATLAWQIQAGDRLTVLAGLARLADRLGLAGDTDQQRARAVAERLSSIDGWVLLFDDASPSTIRGLLPARGGTVLLTSRNPNWAEVAVPFEVGPFPPAAAARFLTPGAAAADEAAEQLARRLGYLPLALAQARGYCAATGRTTGAYLADYRRLLAHADSDSARAAVTTTLSLAMAQARRRSPAAGQLMALLCQLAPTDIPIDLLTAFPDLLPRRLRRAAAGGRPGIDALVTVLAELGLVSLGRPGLLRIHELTGDLLRDPAGSANLGGGRSRAATNRLSAIALRLVCRAVPEDFANPATWERWALLLPHAQVLADRHPPVTHAVAMLRLACGRYLYVRGEHATAARLFTQALDGCRRLLGERHSDTLTAMSNLARTLHDRGELEQARRLHGQALAARREVLGDLHPDTLTSVCNMARVLHDQGDLDQAGRLHEEALTVRRRVIGKLHPDTLTSMCSLARVRHDQGELEQARRLHEHGLAARRAVLGDLHPDTLASISNLARVLHDQGHLDRARRLHEDAFTARHRILGDRHPDTRASAGHLARIQRETGRSS
ncbi:tetratricopeptide repeat protein [Actinoplanes sp. NPDC049118]|uniref:tetratricopeptide repeat protein n=1 Tax=Actinoplanes sp. NPDC049118 TaxID=3155769 RepID=UPI0033F825ED